MAIRQRKKDAYKVELTCDHCKGACSQTIGGQCMLCYNYHEQYGHLRPVFELHDLENDSEYTREIMVELKLMQKHYKEDPDLQIMIKTSLAVLDQMNKAFNTRAEFVKRQDKNIQKETKRGR